MFEITENILKTELSIRSDEGLTLETSAFESLYGGQFTLSTQLTKPDYFGKLLTIIRRHAISLPEFDLLKTQIQNGRLLLSSLIPPA